MIMIMIMIMNHDYHPDCEKNLKVASPLLEVLLILFNERTAGTVNLKLYLISCLSKLVLPI